MLSRLVTAFLPRSKRLLISWLQSPSAVILELKKIKSVTISIVSPSICLEMMGSDAMTFFFWMSFPLSFTFINRLFSFSSHIWRAGYKRRVGPQPPCCSGIYRLNYLLERPAVLRTHCAPGSWGSSFPCHPHQQLDSVALGSWLGICILNNCLCDSDACGSRFGNLPLGRLQSLPKKITDLVGRVRMSLVKSLLRVWERRCEEWWGCIVTCYQVSGVWKLLEAYKGGGSRKMEKASLLGGQAQQLDKRLGPDGWSKVPSGENKQGTFQNINVKYLILICLRLWVLIPFCCLQTLWNSVLQTGLVPLVICG